MDIVDPAVHPVCFPPDQAFGFQTVDDGHDGRAVHKKQGRQIPGRQAVVMVQAPQDAILGDGQIIVADDGGDFFLEGLVGPGDQVSEVFLVGQFLCLKIFDSLGSPKSCT